MDFLWPNRPLISLATPAASHFLACSHHVDTYLLSCHYPLHLLFLGRLYPTFIIMGTYNFDTFTSRSTFPAGQARHRLAVPASHAIPLLVPTIITLFELYLFHPTWLFTPSISTSLSMLNSSASLLRPALVHRNDARDSTHCPRAQRTLQLALALEA